MRSAGVGTSEGLFGSSGNSRIPHAPLNSFRLSPVIRAHRVSADSYIRGVPQQTRTSAPGATPRAELTDERLLATALQYSRDTSPVPVPPNGDETTICNVRASSKIFSSTPMVAAEPPDVTEQANALDSKETVVSKNSRQVHCVSFSLSSKAPSSTLESDGPLLEQNHQQTQDSIEKSVCDRGCNTQ